jgi:PHP family Zn ribbon phosphoesterase
MLAKREGKQEGLQEGKQEGLQEGRASLLLQMLIQRFGRLSQQLQNQVARLTADDLIHLGLAMSSFSEVKQLRNWLAKHKSPLAKNGAAKPHRTSSAKRKKIMSSR